MARRNPWGSIRKLSSGRYQARYRTEGVAYTGPTTFRTKGDANAWLAGVRTDLDRGSWVDPDAGCVTLTDFAITWLAERPGLRPRTRELYEGELRLHILPALGDTQLRHLSTARVRSWHAELTQRAKPGPTTVAKCYRLLRAILSTAVEDELIPKNPCVLKRAGVEKAPERPVATIEQVYALADEIEPRFRALVLLATFTGLRLGELRALRRSKLDLARTSVQVVEQIQELANGTLLTGEPKSDAGRRTVTFPQAIAGDMEAHLASWAVPGPDGLVFCGIHGQPLRRATFYKAWARAITKVDVDPNLRLHDLRHTGNTLAAATGASTKELMARLGHSSPRAALIYQHATPDRDAAIARALSKLIDQRSQAPTRDGVDNPSEQSATG